MVHKLGAFGFIFPEKIAAFLKLLISPAILANTHIFCLFFSFLFLWHGIEMLFLFLKLAVFIGHPATGFLNLCHSNIEMIIKEINCKTILNKSKLMDYCINPYTGCQHKCSYCYARFMKKYTNHKEEWGDFVDVKINAVEALKNDLKKAKPGSVFISSVTDCYQPIEKKYAFGESEIAGRDRP